MQTCMLGASKKKNWFAVADRAVVASQNYHQLRSMIDQLSTEWSSICRAMHAGFVWIIGRSSSIKRNGLPMVCEWQSIDSIWLLRHALGYLDSVLGLCSSLCLPLRWYTQVVVSHRLHLNDCVNPSNGLPMGGVFFWRDNNCFSQLTKRKHKSEHKNWDWERVEIKSCLRQDLRQDLCHVWVLCLKFRFNSKYRMCESGLKYQVHIIIRRQHTTIC